MNIFVTGTDTNVGKTVISTMMAMRLEFRYWKPVQTGASDEGTDSSFVAARIGQSRVQEEAYRLELPASPHLAAEHAGLKIDFDHILNQRPRQSTVIEGAGGVLVPLNDRHLMIDLIAALHAPVVIVASTRLGTINHTLMTLESLRARQLDRLAVIMVGEPSLTNFRAIEKYGQVPVVGQVPLLKDISAEALEQNLGHLKLENSGWI